MKSSRASFVRRFLRYALAAFSMLQRLSIVVWCHYSVGATGVDLTPTCSLFEISCPNFYLTTQNTGRKQNILHLFPDNAPNKVKRWFGFNSDPSAHSNSRPDGPYAYPPFFNPYTDAYCLALEERPQTQILPDGT